MACVDQAEPRNFADGLLTKGGRIDILGCNVAAEHEGKQLIEQLESRYTMDFAGSTDVTAATGEGDMILESDDIDACEHYFDVVTIQEPRAAATHRGSPMVCQEMNFCL